MTLFPGRGVATNVVLSGQRPGYRTWPAGLARWKVGARRYAVALLNAILVLIATSPAPELLFLDFRPSHLPPATG